MKNKINIEEAVKSLQKYINKYDKLYKYKNYQDKTFIDDILYGLGIAIDLNKYRYSQGYDKFKEFLREFLNN